MVFLPLPFLVLAGLILLQRRASESGLREAIVRGAIIWGALLVGITELLSAFDALTRTGVAAAWIVAAIIVWLAWTRYVQKPPAVARPAAPRADLLERAEATVICVIAAVSLALALMSAPATWDALVYHLSRVAHWIQNRNVAPYPTQIPRQLWPGPGAEFVILHLRILSGSDRVVGLVPWLAFVGNIVVASLITRQLGAGRKGQLFTALCVATLPGAVAQAPGGQVELVFSFWLACFVSIFLRVREELRARVSVPDSLFLGASIGLAIFAKATAYLFLAPFLLWLLIAALRQSPRRMVRPAIIAALAALAIVAPQYRRNTMVFGRPLGQAGADGAINTAFSAAGFASNLLRNTALHFGTRSDRINTATYDAVVALDARIGISANDPTNTFPGEPYRPIRFEVREQMASSPLHVLLFVATLIGLLVRGRRRNPVQLFYALSIVGGYLLFCFYLRWQPWHARLHVPLLILAAAVTGWAVERIRWKLARPALVGALTLGALPALLINPARPLLLHVPVFNVPREEQYFAENPVWYPSYREAADYLRSADCRTIGLKIGGNDFEYALWALLERRFGVPPRMRHLQVTAIPNREVVTRQENFIPCAIVYIHSAPRQQPFVVPQGYEFAWQRDSVQIFMRRTK